MKARLAAVATVLLALVACSSTPSATSRTTATGYRTFGAGTGKIQNVTLDAVETVQEIAPGVRYNVWTFGGTTPGPVIRVHQGDTVHFTLNNKSTMGMSHSIDFHAAQTPWDVNYKPVPPGQSISFDFVARFPGVFMYHCGVPPVLHHIANGMYGAIIVEPTPSLPAAREYVLVTSEYYVGPTVHGVAQGDANAMLAAKPTYVVFNGRANQYVDHPLVARPGELIRLWVVNAGPTLTTAFHVIGALFDHVYPSGNPTDKLNGLQTWNVAPGDGAMFELTIPDEGLYPFVTHAFAYTGLGAVGLIKVSKDAPDSSISFVMAEPFSGGLFPSSGTWTGKPPTPPFALREPATSSGPATVTALNIKFDPTTLQFMSGTKLTLANKDPLLHNFTIDSLHIATQLPANSTKVITFAAPPGTYTFYCSISGHRAAGMEGTITIPPSGAH